jgi:hypothetical protein
VIGEVVPCATTPDMLRRASHIHLRAKSAARTMVAKLTPTKLQRLFIRHPQMAAVVNANVNVQQSLVDGSAIANVRPLLAPKPLCVALPALGPLNAPRVEWYFD